MVRRLMLELVGAHELKTMTALGSTRKEKKGKGIPSDIRTGVFSKLIKYIV